MRIEVILQNLLWEFPKGRFSVYINMFSFLLLVYVNNDFLQTFRNDNKIALFIDVTSIVKIGKGNCNMLNDR